MATAMAKKKGEGKPAGGPGRTVLTNIRSTPEWKAWLDELAQFDRSTVADVVDHALVDYARSKNFPKPAPPR